METILPRDPPAGLGGCLPGVELCIKPTYAVARSIALVIELQLDTNAQTDSTMLAAGKFRETCPNATLSSDITRTHEVRLRAPDDGTRGAQMRILRAQAALRRWGRTPSSAPFDECHSKRGSTSIDLSIAPFDECHSKRGSTSTYRPLPAKSEILIHLPGH